MSDNGDQFDAPIHDAKLERKPLGLLIVLPDEACQRAGELSANLFYDLRNKAAWRAIKSLLDEHTAPDKDKVVTRLVEKEKDLDIKLARELIAELDSNAATLFELPEIITELKDLSRRRSLELDMTTKWRAMLRDRGTPVDSLAKDIAAACSVLAQNGHNALPPIDDCADATTYDTPKPPVLIEGLAHRSTKFCLGGSSKSFKTWSLIDLGLSVATGTPFWGMETRKGRVLYVNFEIHKGFFNDRVKAVAEAKQITLEPRHFEHWCLRGRAVDFDRLLSEFLARLSDGDYGLVALDPTYKLLGTRDENKAGDVASLLNSFERLCVETGAMVCFGSHYSKGNQAGKESTDRISGSGVFARDPDSILTMTRHEQDGAFVVEPTLRNFAAMEPFCVKWEYPLMRRADLDPTKLKQPGRPKTHSEDELYQLLPSAGLATGEWQQMADDECGIKHSTFHRLRKALEQNKRVLKSKVNSKWTPIIVK